MKTKIKPKYSIIIATRNEEEAIAKVICDIPKSIEKESEIIVVDSSTDATPKIAKELRVKLIRSRKGKGRQMKKGVEKSNGEILIFLDGDGTDPSSFIPKLLKKLEKADLVLGCRSQKSFKTDDLWMKEVFRIYRTFIRPLFRLINFNVSDPLAGFRAIRRNDWDRLKLKSNEFEIETEMNIKAIEKKFIVKEIPIPHLKRGGGLRKSKLVTNPKMWLAIFKTIVSYIKKKKIKISDKANFLKNF